MRKSSFVALLAFSLAGLAVAAVNAQESDTQSAKKISRIHQDRNLTAKSLKHSVQPEYPREAKGKWITGTVRLHVIIDRDGSVGQTEVISGDPLLVKSSLDAVRQWKYYPALLNGDPVEVDTTIDLIFALNR